MKAIAVIHNGNLDKCGELWVMSISTLELEQIELTNKFDVQDEEKVRIKKNS
jgi:hypothetical protein